MSRHPVAIIVNPAECQGGRRTRVAGNVRCTLYEHAGVPQGMAVAVHADKAREALDWLSRLTWECFWYRCQQAWPFEHVCVVDLAT